MSISSNIQIQENRKNTDEWLKVELYKLIKMLSQSDLNSAIELLREKYHALPILWYEPACYRIIWEHERITNWNSSCNSIMKRMFFTLIQDKQDPTKLVFIYGRMGMTTNYFIDLIQLLK